MKYKARILDLLKDAHEDVLSMSVEQLIEKLTGDVEQDKKEELEECNKVCEKYAGIYLRMSDNDTLFGPRTEYIRIGEIKPGSFTTDFDRVYDIQGHSVSFSLIHNVSKDLVSGHAHDCMTQDELDGATIIKKEEYEDALRQLSAISELSKTMIQYK